MWKDSYRIGIESIDRQHMELFKRTDALLDAIRKNAGAEKYRETIAFLKQYVAVHFHDEEVYQESIHYSGLAFHQKAHRDFTATVLEFEKRLEAGGYDAGTVKELAGTLLAWLVYHVTGADQRIAAGDEERREKISYDFLETFSKCTREILDKVIGLKNLEEASYLDDVFEGDVFVSVELKGDVTGRLIFGFTKALAFRIVECLTASVPEKMDEFVFCTLVELADIASGNAINARAAGGAQYGSSLAQRLSAREVEGILEFIPVRTGIVGLDLKYVPQAVAD